MCPRSHSRMGLGGGLDVHTSNMSAVTKFLIQCPTFSQKGWPQKTPAVLLLSY